MIPWQIIEMTMAVHTPDAPNSMTSDRSEDRGRHITHMATIITHMVPLVSPAP